MKLPAFSASVLALLLVSACGKKYELSSDRGTAEHVVVMVWDGMRPDMVSEKNTPNLWALAQRGVFFANHHPAFPSTTEVNGTALATGMSPAHSGIIGNREFRPAIDPRKGVATEELQTVRKDDELKHGKHIATPTVAETVQQAGFRTAVAGTKPVALLQDRAEVRTSEAARESVDVFAGKSAPADAAIGLRKARGDFPMPVKFPNTAQDRWTTDVLTGELWKSGVPKYSVLWVSDPDFSQHATAPGAPTALAAIRSADDMLGIVLATLKARGVLDQTDIFVVSDHGFSTVSETVDIAKALTAAGLRAHRSFSAPPDKGDILIVNTGATALLYVTGHDAETTAKLVRVLQALPSTGVVFSREAIEGTFPLSAAGVDSPDAPDVVVAPRWSAEKNEFGVPGTLVYDGGKKTGAGMHGSLSPFDQTNTLVGAGPDLRTGWRDELPSGNIDVAPTVLWLMGIHPLAKPDGRVLFEALRDRKPDDAKPEEKRTEAARDLGAIRWTQYLRTVTFQGATYLLEGSGVQSAK
ncbi:MAG: alkaline phosphatase family protein [Chthoniobacteraceae bacterium]